MPRFNNTAPTLRHLREVHKRRQLSEVERVAREELGFASLRPGQEEAVRSVLAGRDTVVIQPTGSGKSAIYQAAGLLIDGPTVVVSPLIALQKDQAESITGQPHSANAAVVNSTLAAGRAREIFDRLVEGHVEFVFLAPEQLRKPETLAKLKEAAPSLVVIDEAHCISEWGHDFRPGFPQAARVVRQRPPRLRAPILTWSFGPIYIRFKRLQSRLPSASMRRRPPEDCSWKESELFYDPSPKPH